MSIKAEIKRLIVRFFPTVWYLYVYRRAWRLHRMPDLTRQRDQLFRDLIDLSRDKHCLQIGVRGESKFGSSWVSVDLFDTSPRVDFNYDIHDLKFSNGTFDVVVCNAILEHVRNPERAISELHRVLRPGGVIWVEVPFNQPFHPDPGDFWRVTLEGIRLWMAEFTELHGGYCRVGGSAIYNFVLFHGFKPSE